MSLKGGFGVATRPVGALYIHQVHVECAVLPKWPPWAHLFCPVFCNVSVLRRDKAERAR